MAGPELELRPEDGLRWYYPSRRHGWVAAGAGGFFAYFLAQSTYRANDSGQMYVALGFLLIVAPMIYVAWRHLLRGRPTLIATTFGLVTDPIGHPHRLLWWHEISRFRCTKSQRLPGLMIYAFPDVEERVFDLLYPSKVAKWGRANLRSEFFSDRGVFILATELDAPLEEVAASLEAMRVANLGTAARVYENGRR